MRRLRNCLIFLVLGLLGQYLWHWHSCTFYRSNIHPPLSLSLSSQQQLPELKERFYYLGEGRQCFAFESEDHQRVIKFFKARHLKRNHWLKEGLLGYRKNKAWEEELASTALRYQLAEKKIPEETGILLLHFNETEHLKKKITVYSKFHIPYEIDLDKVPFILQEKAEGVAERLDRLLATGDRAGAMQSIRLLQDLLIKRVKAGVTDQRQCFRVNYGFGTKDAMQIDVGKIKLLETSEEAEIVRVTGNLKRWVNKNYPELPTEW